MGHGLKLSSSIIAIPGTLCPAAAYCCKILRCNCMMCCRKKFVEVLKEKFGDYSLTYSIGGQISFDVFPQVSQHMHASTFINSYRTAVLINGDIDVDCSSVLLFQLAIQEHVHGHLGFSKR